MRCSVRRIMPLTFTTRLVNGPFGDPGLCVHLPWQGRALLFDLGHNDALPAADFVRVSHVFVSHCHMDHFIGFDRMLRLFLARDKKLVLFGPPGIIDCVAGKLRGYTWNLVENYPFTLEVCEVALGEIRRATFPAAQGFTPTLLPTLPFTGTLLDEPAFRVRTAHLEHRIDSLGFALEEKAHFNVDKAELAHLGVYAGPWLSELKEALRRGESDDYVITARWHVDGEERCRDFALGRLRGRLIHETPGHKLAYVVDTLFSPENAARIAKLAQGADVFFCEAPFLEVDREQASGRYHLTARQAGLLGRAATAKQLVVFHFSPRYSGQRERLYDEAQQAFRGEFQEEAFAARPTSEV
jgi:ribonuclease Z